jgi:hypothetical protein
VLKRINDEWLEEMYAEECRNGLFDDDYEYQEIFGYQDPDEDWYWDSRFYDDDLGIADRVSPGNHVRSLEKTYLVLKDYRWANLLTGEVTEPRRNLMSCDEKIF